MHRGLPVIARVGTSVARVAGLIATLAAGAAQLAAAQTAASPDADREARGSDDDPTRPVFFSLRPEFYATGAQVRRFALIGRYDAALVRRPGFGAILRLELPVTGARTGSLSAGGIGDVYGQILVPWFLTRRFAVAAGAGLFVPTADSELLGGGHWTVAPLVAPVWRLPGGMFFIKVQHLRAIAGDASRPDPGTLLVTPTFVHVIVAGWWVTADSESRTSTRAGGRTDLRSGVQLGRIMAPGVGVWIKPEVWWGPNQDGRWNLKFGLVWYARRPQA